MLKQQLYNVRMTYKPKYFLKALQKLKYSTSYNDIRIHDNDSFFVEVSTFVQCSYYLHVEKACGGYYTEIQ